jgi:hypothetical protein
MTAQEIEQALRNVADLDAASGMAKAGHQLPQDHAACLWVRGKRALRQLVH